MAKKKEQYSDYDSVGMLSHIAIDNKIINKKTNHNILLNENKD